MLAVNNPDPDSNTIGVLIIDDHEVLAVGVSTWLSTTLDIRPLGICTRPEDAIKAILSLSPDVVVLDLEFPLSQMSAAALIAEINQLENRPKILVLSAFYTVSHVLSAYKSGIDGYILKTSGDIEIIQAIRVVHSGQRLFDPEVDNIVRDYVPSPNLTAIANDLPNDLTVREGEVLELIAAGNSNREISKTLVISEKTVKSHISNILPKLGVKDRNQAAVWYRIHGPRRRDNDS